MLNQLKNPHFYIVFIGDLILMSLSLVFAYLMRFEFTLTSNSLEQIALLLPLVVPLKALIFYLMDVYRGMFRYAGLSDILRLFRANFVRRQESRKHWMSDQVRHDGVWLFTCRVNIMAKYFRYPKKG